MNREEDIVRIDLIKNIQIKNKHNDFITPKQDIIIVSFRNGKSRIIDLASEVDITDIDYFEILKSNKTKYKVIFKEWERY